MAKCWDLHGRPTNLTANIAQDAPGVGGQDESGIYISREAYTQLVQNQGPSSSRPASSHLATASQTGTQTALLSSTPRTWVIDSGTSQHMTGDTGTLSSLHTSSVPSTVTLADGSTSAVTGVGIAHPTSSMTLSSVLHVPHFPLSLLSVSQITKHLDCLITFSSSSCVFQDRKTGKTFGSGTERGGLYYLTLDSLSASSPHGLLSQSSSLRQLHCQLGHPSLPQMKVLVMSLV